MYFILPEIIDWDGCFSMGTFYVSGYSAPTCWQLQFAFRILQVKHSYSKD
jgi:hypothetical protein